MFKINTVSGRWLIFTSFLAIKKKYYSEQNKDNQGSFFIKYKKNWGSSRSIRVVAIEVSIYAPMIIRTIKYHKILISDF